MREEEVDEYDLKLIEHNNKSPSFVFIPSSDFVQGPEFERMGRASKLLQDVNVERMKLTTSVSASGLNPFHRDQFQKERFGTNEGETLHGSSSKKQLMSKYYEYLESLIDARIMKKYDMRRVKQAIEQKEKEEKQKALSLGKKQFVKAYPISLKASAERKIAPQAVLHRATPKKPSVPKLSNQTPNRTIEKKKETSKKPNATSGKKKEMWRTSQSKTPNPPKMATGTKTGSKEKKEEEQSKKKEWKKKESGIDPAEWREEEETKLKERRRSIKVHEFLGLPPPVFQEERKASIRRGSKEGADAEVKKKREEWNLKKDSEEKIKKERLLQEQQEREEREYERKRLEELKKEEKEKEKRERLEEAERRKKDAKEVKEVKEIYKRNSVVRDERRKSSIISNSKTDHDSNARRYSFAAASSSVGKDAKQLLEPVKTEVKKVEPIKEEKKIEPIKTENKKVEKVEAAKESPKVEPGPEAKETSKPLTLIGYPHMASLIALSPHDPVDCMPIKSPRPSHIPAPNKTSLPPLTPLEPLPPISPLLLDITDEASLPANTIRF